MGRDLREGQMKLLAFGLIAGLGFFGACLAFGHYGMKCLDDLDLEDDGWITVYPKVK